MIQTKANVRNAGDTSSAWAELTSLNGKALDVIDGKYGNFAGEAMNKLKEAQAKAQTLIAQDTYNNGGTITRSAAIPVIKELDAALKPFASYIN